MTHARPIPAYGPDGYTVPPERYNAPPPPALGSAHQWVCTAIFGISQAAVDRVAAAWMAGDTAAGLDMDHENLLTVQGPGCYRCGMPLNQTTYQTPCPVQVIPILTVN